MEKKARTKAKFISLRVMNVVRRSKEDTIAVIAQEHAKVRFFSDGDAKVRF